MDRLHATARRARVGDLRLAGFVVTATPTRRIALHVSISRAAEWTSAADAAFDLCFSHPSDETEGTVS